MSSVKRLTLDDAERVTELHAHCFDTSWPLSDMEAHIQNDLVLGWGADGLSDDISGNISGFIIIRIVFEQSEVLTLAVDPNARRQGIAEKLLQAAGERLQKKSVKSLFLDVAEDNLAAIALYRKAGFEGFGRRPRYYKRAKGRVAALNFAKRF